MRRLMASYDKLEERGICIPINEISFKDTTRAHPLSGCGGCRPRVHPRTPLRRKAPGPPRQPDPSYLQ